MLELFKKLNINPNNLNLYNLAFSHSSYVNENNLKQDYERLEFLGDAVLELVVSDYLFNNYNLEEGKMTKIRANYVCENACFIYAENLNFSKYIKVSNGEEKDNGRHKPVIEADIFESLMGAIYLDLGFDVVKRVLLEIIVPYIKDNREFLIDYKSRLQELVQTDRRTVKYEVVKEEGPQHNKIFTTNVYVDNILYGTGKGHSKKESEQNAAENALNKLATN